uniref:Replication protein A subunit n=1 Tax=Aceria tosichella TaxID=561515 RepID=A0A6G1SHJ3_9ACAR
MESLLSAGALTQILEGEKPAYPVFQVIGYKPMGPDQTSFGQEATEELRYRLMIGDGIQSHQYCIITNQDLVQELKTGRIVKWSIIRVLSYQTHDCELAAGSSKRRIIHILTMEVVKKGLEVGKKLSVDPSAMTVSNVPAPRQPAANLDGNNNQQLAPPKPSPNFDHQQPTMQEYAHEPLTQPQPYPMQQQQSMNMGRSPRPMKSGHDSQTIGIGELTPYIGKWVVKGRCISKSGIREYTNAKGNGKVFSFTLADKTGEVKITAFNADCERVFPYVEPTKVYILGRASVKSADKRYTTADFEITLNQDSLLEEVTDSAVAGDIPMAKFNFCSIGSLANIPPNQPVDLIGAITTVSDVTSIMSKTKNKELKKRNITIVDMSRHTISVTIWDQGAETFTGQVGDVFVTKGARIGSYGGKSASAGDCMFVNLDIPEVRKIRNWYSNLIDQNFTNLTSSQDAPGSADNWRCLSQLNDLQTIKDITSGGVTALYSRCKAMLMTVGRNPVYKCCQNEGCGKKLVDTQRGDMECQKCGQTFSRAKYRYKTDVKIEDQSSSSWVTLWDDKAEAMFGMKPEELERHMKMENKEIYEKLVTKPNFKPFVFVLRSKIETYNNEERVKHTVVSLNPMDPVAQTRQIISEIKALAN